MAEIDEEVKFHTKADTIEYITRTNGDRIHFLSLKLSL